MTQKFDWDSIRVRLARGETAYQISKSLGDTPARQYIMKYAKKRNWMIGESNIPNYVKNLPLVQNGGKQLSKRTPETVNAILGFIGSGAPLDVAANAAGITPQTLYRWQTECPEFQGLVRTARANKQVEWVEKLDKAKDWKAQLKLLQVSPETKEHFADRQKDEGPTIILNIHRDEVVVEPVVVGRTEVEQPILDVKNEEALPCIDEHELIEEQEPVKKPGNWQGGTFEKNLQSEQRALEARVMGSRSRRLLSPKKNDA